MLAYRFIRDQHYTQVHCASNRKPVELGPGFSCGKGQKMKYVSLLATAFLAIAISPLSAQIDKDGEKTLVV